MSIAMKNGKILINLTLCEKHDPLTTFAACMQVHYKLILPDQEGSNMSHDQNAPKGQSCRDPYCSQFQFHHGSK